MRAYPQFCDIYLVKKLMFMNVSMLMQKQMHVLISKTHRHIYMYLCMCLSMHIWKKKCINTKISMTQILYHVCIYTSTLCYLSLYLYTIFLYWLKSVFSYLLFLEEISTFCLHVTCDRIWFLCRLAFLIVVPNSAMLV